MGATIISEASTGTAELRRNIITNPDFESATTGWSVLTGATVTRVTTEFYAGVACARVVTPGVALTEGIIWSTAAVAGLVAGSKFSVAVWVKAPIGAALTLLAASTGAGAANVSVPIVGTGAWQLLKAQNATLGATLNPYLAVYTRSPIQAVTFYVDLGTICLGTTIGTPFSGNTADQLNAAGNPIMDYSWAGTANASQSIETAVMYDEIVPELVTSTQSGRDLRTVIVNVPGSSTPYVSLEASGLRTGTLELFFARDEDAAAEAEATIAAGGVFFLDYPERQSWEMRFIPVGRLERRLDETTRDHWTVSFDYQELAG